MAYQKELRANIVLGGRTDKTFGHLGTALEALGGQIDRISQRVIDFGRQSVETYVNYEDAMLDAKVAMATQYDSTNELNRAMETLDKAAMQWSASSRFTTDDMANAISNASHAGWDLQQVLNGVPAAMNISLAGGMDLAGGLEYLVDITNAAGLSFSELTELTDYWAYAANSSSTTIPEMGAAMQKMGATMQFVKGDMAGLTTMLAVLADNGAKGTEAGTLLRNSMIRLIAPTEKAALAMEALELSEEDLEDIYSDPKALEEANRLLKEMGFDAYDAQGNLKGFLNIWEELQKATSGMSEEKRNQVLSAIFPTRTITGALALLDAAGKEWDGLYQSILENSEGYAEYARDTMESGLGGALRRTEAALDVLKAKTGKKLSGQVEKAADAFSGLINWINELDDDKFGAMVSGFETLAFIGPGLTVAGGAIRLLSSTGLFGWAAVVATGLLAVTGAVNDFNRSVYESKFGTLELDQTEIGSALNELGNAFSDTQGKIAKYNTSVETAISDYTEASGTFKESLLTNMLTGAALTEEDIASLNGLGDQMRRALLQGIDGSFSADEEAIFHLSGLVSAEDGAKDRGVGGQILSLLNIGYEESIAQAEQLSQALRDAMTSAFEDGTLTEDEVSNIQSIFDQMNELMASQASKEIWMEQQKLLRQAQTVGLDGLEALSGQAETLRDEKWELREQAYDQARWELKKQYEGHKGQTIDGVTYDDKWYAQANDWLNEQISAEKQAHNAEFDRYLLDLWNSTVRGSELGGAWGRLSELADLYFSGAVDAENAHDAFAQMYGESRFASGSGYDNNTESSQLGEYMARMVAAFGGYDEIEARIAHYEKQGDTESAGRLKRLYAMEQIVNDYAVTGVMENGKVSSSSSGEYAPQQLNRERFEGYMGESVSDYSLDAARQMVAFFDRENGSMSRVFQAFQSGDAREIESAFSGMNGAARAAFDDMMAQIMQSYDLDRLLQGDGSPAADSDHAYRDYYAAGKLLFDENINAEEYRFPVVPEVDTEQIVEQTEAVSPEVVILGDNTLLKQSIDEMDGREISVNVRGAAGGGGGKRMSLYAEGGRADEASIFGEAGPEWAIPEEHSRRTAELLDRARAASGFTWDELLSRNGGLNAGGGERTIVYSPTIYAQDAAGVEEKLIEDKKRLLKMLRDLKMKDDVEAYA